MFYIYFFVSPISEVQYVSKDHFVFYDLWEILRVTEGELAPVSCLQTDASPCQRAGECRTLSVWQGYYDLTRKYFSGITLADLMAVPQGDNYVI